MRSLAFALVVLIASSTGAFQLGWGHVRALSRSTTTLQRISQEEADNLIKRTSTGNTSSMFGDAFARNDGVNGQGPIAGSASSSYSSAQPLQPDSPLSRRDSTFPSPLSPPQPPSSTNSEAYRYESRNNPLSVDDSVPPWFPNEGPVFAEDEETVNGFSSYGESPMYSGGTVSQEANGASSAYENPKYTNSPSRSQDDSRRGSSNGRMFSRETIAKVANGKTDSYRQSYASRSDQGWNYEKVIGAKGAVGDDAEWWEQRNDQSSFAYSSRSTAPYKVPHDNTGKHLGFLVAGTLWWYVLSSLKMIADPPVDFFGLGEDTIQIMGLFVALSQVAMFSGCSRLSKSKTLAEAQKTVCAMAAVFLPANFVVSLVNPFEAKGITVLACAEVTMCLGIFLSHYLRKASYREIPPQDSSALTVRDDSFKGIIGHLKDYRPPMKQQATHSAVALTRSFTAFYIATSTVGQYIVYDDYSNPLAMLALLIVALHSGLECAITTVFPGARLDKYSTFLSYETILYSVHMFAASLATAQSVFTDTSLLDTTWDQYLFLWLFLNALVKVMAKSTGLLSRINFDRLLGLSDLDRGAT